MGPMSVNDSLLQKRRGNDPRVFAMTLNLHEDRGPSAANSKEVADGQNHPGEATELSLLPSCTSLGTSNSTEASSSETEGAPRAEHPVSAVSQPIPPPQKSNDEMEPPPTPKRKVSFAPDLLPPEDALTSKGDQDVLRDGSTPPRTPPHYLAQRTQLEGISSMPTAEEVERILQARIRGPLLVMVTLLLLVVLLLFAISGTMVYFLLTLRDEIINRRNSTLPPLKNLLY